MSTSPTPTPNPANVISDPVVPAQPNEAIYSIGMLYLFTKIYNSSEAYQAATGYACPPVNFSMPQKNWWDSSLAGQDPNAPVQYTVAQLNKDGSWSIAIITLTVSQAMAINVPSGANSSDPALMAWLQQPNIPIPIRPLLPNEQLVYNPFGCNVIRTDMQGGSTGNGAPDFTSTDRATMNTINAWVQAIGNWFHVTPPSS